MWYKVTDSGVIIEAKIQTKSSRKGIELLNENQLKIKVNTPPIDGKANEAVIKLIAQKLHISKSSVTIIRGLTSKLKTIKIENINSEQIESLIK